MQLTHTITPRADAAPAVPEHEIAKASIFLRHNIHKDLKQEYLEVCDSLTLWQALEERFGKQKTVVLPQARRDYWGQLRFLDFKSVQAYNSALHRIVVQLRFCGQRVTDAEMIEKTLETFHPSNMVLQQQYRNNRYRKYSELINVLLAAETQNELLMKNFNMRPVGSNALPEAHASFHKKNKTFYKKGMHSKKQGHNCPQRPEHPVEQNPPSRPPSPCIHCLQCQTVHLQCQTVHLLFDLFSPLWTA